MDERGLGKRLQAARQKAGLTQQQLCQKANLSFSTLTKIERGAIKSPSIFTIQAIAGAIGTSLDELVGVPVRPARQLSRTKSGASFIYFDMNGCLVHFSQAAFTRIAADTGKPADLIEAAFWQYNDEACRGQLSMADFNAALAKKIGVESLDWQKYYLEAVEPVHEMREIVEWAAKHYKVGLFTNTAPGLVSALRSSGQLPDIAYDAIIDSSEVGVIKPESRIYEIAAERADCSPEEIILIDDTRPNLMAAAKMGWGVMWFDEVQTEKSAAAVRQILEPDTAKTEN
ncbi:MAG TPA: HAD-IA family hydrolase [Candidatus Saccharimonadales bacterium]|nr:HAD-IA family hydrolase [Candidatus Saccharimonadales bacterium]